ncbi:MAG: pyruvate kinase [Burkholderiales bacterium]
MRKAGGGTASDPWNDAAVHAAIDGLTRLRQDLLALERKREPQLRGVHSGHRASARNLVHYIALRREDRRALQERLAWIGVSSLGRAESHVLANVDKALGLLHRLAGRTWTPHSSEEPAGFVTGRNLLRDNAARLLGALPAGRSVRIMVTLDAAMVGDPARIRRLLEAGMDCARINCAHDDEDTWRALVDGVREAAQAAGRPCRILMDLGGPKVRTGPLPLGPAVLKWRPRRDVLGRLVTPARVFLRAEGSSLTPEGADVCLDLDPAWLARLEEGDVIDFEDARGAPRQLRVVAGETGGWWSVATRTAYVTPETVFRRPGAKHSAQRRETRPSGIAPVPRRLVLRPGDTLKIRLTGDLESMPPVPSDPGRPPHHEIGCTLPAAFEHVKVGDRIWFDDGRIGGRVRAIDGAAAEVEIVDARPQGQFLGADKGINLPDSRIALPALTEKDLADLDFVVAHADIVGLSFVQGPADVRALRKQLEVRQAADLGVLLKIETRTAFERLPDILLAGLASPAVGVMIARGDLAVECGFERLAEVQEEILWIAEAAHLPVVWATQVLESLARTGRPSRAEVTDAAMGERAECVMLNKGEHILEAVKALDSILARMEAHQVKKRSMLRQLHWWVP